MRTFLLNVAFCAAVLPWAAANFDVYRVTHSGFRETTIWQVFEAQADCNTAWKTTSYADTSDVSGSKTGFRCEGSGCGEKPPPGDIEELEMHFSNNPLYHWTIYKNRNFEMIGLDGNKYGDCIVFPDGDFRSCRRGGAYLNGYRKFRCLTQFTADQVNEAS